MTVENFDALGVLGTEELRTELSRVIPLSHRQGLSGVAFRPAAFCGHSENVIGLYSKPDHQVLVRPKRFGELARSLKTMKDELQSSTSVMDRLNVKRTCTVALSDRFASAATKVLRIVYHEIGHHVYSQLIRLNEVLVERWHYLYHLRREHISSCADISEEENFAECYMHYVDNQGAFDIGGFDQEYKAMQRVFSM